MFSDQESTAAFFEVQAGLPRQGPGSDASTLRALQCLPDLRPDALVVDLGCGPGRQTLVLVQALGLKVVAVDTHQPFLDQLLSHAAGCGLSDGIDARNAPMETLEFAGESVDLIWAEGSLYLMGVANALHRFRPMLRPGGAIAFTELSWTAENPPAEAAEYFSTAYPEMVTVEGNRLKAAAQGYEVVYSFELPAEDWWTDYYGPLSERIELLRPGAGEKPALQRALETAEEEIRMFTRHGDSYGYVFYIVRKPE